MATANSYCKSRLSIGSLRLSIPSLLVSVSPSLPCISPSSQSLPLPFISRTLPSLPGHLCILSLPVQPSIPSFPPHRPPSLPVVQRSSNYPPQGFNHRSSHLLFRFLSSWRRRCVCGGGVVWEWEPCSFIDVPSLIVVLIAVDPQAFCFRLGARAYISVPITPNETTLKQLLKNALLEWKKEMVMYDGCVLYEWRQTSPVTIEELRGLTEEHLKDNSKWKEIVFFGPLAEAKPMERPYVVVVPEEQGEDCVPLPAIMLAVLGLLPVGLGAIQWWLCLLCTLLAMMFLYLIGLCSFT